MSEKGPEKTPLRLKENVSSFYLKRKGVLFQT